ncbi:hypothetical protein ABIG06_007313 [Bradyrhizobium sp. USDA 326]
MRLSMKRFIETERASANAKKKSAKFFCGIPLFLPRTKPRPILSAFATHSSNDPRTKNPARYMKRFT